MEDFPGKGKLACYPVSVEGEDVVIHATKEVLSNPVVRLSCFSLIPCLG